MSNYQKGALDGSGCVFLVKTPGSSSFQNGGCSTPSFSIAPRISKHTLGTPSSASAGKYEFKVYYTGTVSGKPYDSKSATFYVTIT